MMDALLNNVVRTPEHELEPKDDHPIIFVQHRPPQHLVPQQSRPIQAYQHQHQPPVRSCEFCGSSNTPTWRRGPAGKASLCNACGIKWRLRKRLKKGDQYPPSAERSKLSSPNNNNKKKKDDNAIVRKTIIKDRHLNDPHHSHHLPLNQSHIIERGRRKHYYCKYCKQTWAISHFKNSQQFGAHCSNCSRRPANGSASPLSDHDAMSDDHYFDEMPYSEDEEEHKVPFYSASPPLSPPRPPRFHSALAMAASPPSPDHLMVPSSPSSPDALLLGLLHVVSHQLVDEDDFAVLRSSSARPKLDVLANFKSSPSPSAFEGKGHHHVHPMHDDLQHLAAIASDVRINSFRVPVPSSRFSRVPRYD